MDNILDILMTIFKDKELKSKFENANSIAEIYDLFLQKGFKGNIDEFKIAIKNVLDKVDELEKN